MVSGSSWVTAVAEANVVAFKRVAHDDLGSSPNPTDPCSFDLPIVEAICSAEEDHLCYVRDPPYRFADAHQLAQ